MYKVFIADDNSLTVQALRATVPWEEWGFTLVGQAENGIDAKEQIEFLSPDIAILDINMPGKTGLEVAEELTEKKPLLIFLTAYDEFSYARTALKIGAFDYLLKPLDNGKLETVLKQAKEKLDRERQSAAFSDSMKSQYENWTAQRLQQGINGRPVTELEEVLKREWKPVGYELLLVDTVATWTGEEIDRLTESIRRCLTGLEAAFQFRYIYTCLKEGMLILLGFQRVSVLREYDLTALRIANRIVETGRENGMEVFVGISNYAEGSLESLPKLYEEVTFSAGSRFFLENKTVVHYKSITSKNFRNEYMLSRKMQDMFRVLYTSPGDFEGLLDEFIELTLREDCYDVEYIKNIYTQIAFTISCSMQEKNNGDYPARTMEMILEDMRQINSMQSIISYIRTYTQQMTAQLKEENCLMSAQGRKALDFINTHYMENITLQDVAEDAGISESHLCRVLKKETGESFVNILNKIRVQQARKLLQKGDFKVYEIAEMVGFSNYAYFYHVFKKITGFSPKECH